MSRQSERQRDQERARLLAEIDAANAAGMPLSAEHRDRVVSMAAEDIRRVWESQSV
jgi:hypothetical protein